MPTALFVSAGGAAPSVSEVTADEPDDDRARVLTRRMRELDKPRLAKCDQSGGDGGASMGEWLLSRRGRLIVARHEVPG